jgi:signal transduction histidine kinase
MRRRIVTVAVVTALLAVALFAIPLAISVRQLAFNDERTELERVALNAAAAVGPGFNVGDPTELPTAESGTQLGLYGPDGGRLTGTGPQSADAATRAALAGHPSDAQAGSWLVVTVPVSSSENVVAAIRAAAPQSGVWRGVATKWVAMAVIATVALVVAWQAARLLARRVSRPLLELASAADELGAGDFAVRTAPSGLAEVDRVGQALNATADRLGRLVVRERRLSADASHQLRTPLTGLRARLEAALSGPSEEMPEAIQQALLSTDRLEATIDDLIHLSRDTIGPLHAIDVRQVVEDADRRWAPVAAAQGRPLRTSLASGPIEALATASAVTQILDVLIDNALRHGAGVIAVSAQATASVTTIEVADEGGSVPDGVDVFARGVTTSQGSGIGLELARRIAQDQGGRLQLSQRQPSTRFTLLLVGDAQGHHG